MLTLPDPAARFAAGLPPVHVELGYGYATGPDCQPDLECRLTLHAAAYGLRLTHLLIDTALRAAVSCPSQPGAGASA